MSKILLTCQRCGKQAQNEAGEWALSGLCSACGIKDVIQPYHSELTRLLRKRERYTKAGINVLTLDRQMGALIGRIERKARDASPGRATQVRQVMQETLAELVESRLVVARAKTQ